MDSEKVSAEVSPFTEITNWFQSLSNFEIAAIIISILVILFIIIRFFGPIILELLGEILSALD